MLNTPHPYDLVIGLDRSDKKADLCLIDTLTGNQWAQTIDTSPESLHHWLTQLRAQHPQARVGLILEQPALNLIGFLESVDWIRLYAINPLTLLKFREAFVTSRAKDDAKDAQYLAELLFTHHPKLKPWLPEDSQTRLLQQLVSHRRAVVNERTSLTNRLQAWLKQYFPQALHLCGDELWRPLATDFLLKWPTLLNAKQVPGYVLKEPRVMADAAIQRFSSSFISTGRAGCCNTAGPPRWESNERDDRRAIHWRASKEAESFWGAGQVS